VVRNPKFYTLSINPDKELICGSSKGGSEKGRT